MLKFRQILQNRKIHISAIEMKVTSVLLQLSLMNCTISFILRKPIETNPVSPRAIKFTFLANDHYKNGVEVPRLENLIKSLRIPGFKVYHIVFNRKDARNDEKIQKSTIKLNIKPVNENSNSTDEYLPNIALDENNFNDRFEPKQVLVTDNILDEHNCGDQNSTDSEKCNEETTTDIYEATTNIDLLNENSTATSDYDENYGSLSDRSQISPSLLASLVG